MLISAEMNYTHLRQAQLKHLENLVLYGEKTVLPAGSPYLGMGKRERVTTLKRMYCKPTYQQGYHRAVLRP